MSYERMKELIEKISCEVVLADSDDPQTWSGLLPILKTLHSECMKVPLKSEAAKVIDIRDFLWRKDPSKKDNYQTRLEAFVAELSKTIEDQENLSQDLSDQADENQTDENQEELFLLEKKLEKLFMLIAAFCPEEIPDLGSMLNCLDDLLEHSKGSEFLIVDQITAACKEYVENMTLENIYNTKPIEEGVVLLKSVLMHIKNKEAFVFDYSDVLELLKVKLSEDKISGEPVAETIDANKKDGEKQIVQASPTKISDDDMEILADFISEAQENLESIEVNLVDLEQDPSNAEILNEIFRPFHTIKGVSGFLSLTKINKLAHATENLLDSARSGDFLINDTATDLILESVDTLKELISRINQGMNTGFLPPDDDIDTKSLSDRLTKLQSALKNGETELLGSILVRKNLIDQDSLDDALESQKTQPDKKIGEILVESRKVEEDQVDTALAEQNQSKKKMDAQVKVSTQKLDDLVDYAGELVIAQSMLRQKTMNDPSLSQNVSQLGQIVTNMQNIAMSMRMIPIKATFMKMIRLVRDLARKSGKDMDLTMVGEDTEIDRNVVEALYEPMVHMIRNSCDHGIEPSSERLKNGKSAKGEIILRAYHRGGHIIIEIEDDGRGLDPQRILEKARSTGLITGAEQLTDAQIFDLILQPGFSTAKEITDVSGRGVGMDVVKSGIEKFRGQLNIDSEYGKGTKFTISLPLTLAIIDGMLVRVDEERYVIPTIAIQKAFKPGENEFFTVEGKGEMVKDRGTLIPMIRLNEIYSSSTGKKSVKDGLVVVVESKEEKRALLIDELLGKDEYVIKSLGSNLKDVDGLAGGAILADGRVGLILDIHGVFSIVSNG